MLIKRDTLFVNLQTIFNLDSFLFSGRELASVDFLLRFLAQHPKLSFLGLMMNDLSAHPVFMNNENLTVTGKANEKQVLEALRRYHYRPKYIEKALYHLFQLTNVRIDLIISNLVYRS